MIKEQFTKKIQRSDIESIQKALNSLMPIKFDWWKGIQIENISYSPIRRIAKVGGSLKVDEQWGYSQFRNFYMDKPFPGNAYWGEGHEEDAVLLGDIIGPSDTSKKFYDEFGSIFSMITGLFTSDLNVNYLILEFV